MDCTLKLMAGEGRGQQGEGDEVDGVSIDAVPLAHAVALTTLHCKFVNVIEYRGDYIGPILCTISVYGNSCNCLFFSFNVSHLLSFPIYYHPQGKIRSQEIVKRQKIREKKTNRQIVA